MAVKIMDIIWKICYIGAMGFTYVATMFEFDNGLTNRVLIMLYSTGIGFILCGLRMDREVNRLEKENETLHKEISSLKQANFQNQN